MALTHQTELYQIVEAMVYPLTSDVVGSAATYGSGVPLIGPKTVAGPTPAVAKKELRGGGQSISKRSKITGWTAPMTFAKLNFDALPILIGGAVTDSGTTPNQKVNYAHLDTGATLPYFKLVARTDGTDVIGGDGRLTFWKCQMDAGSIIGLNDEDYHIFGVGLELSRLRGTVASVANKDWDFDLWETAAVLVA